jgi:hypothetical protein
MANIVLIEQWVDSMEKAVFQLEKAMSDNEKNEINRLRTTIFDLYTKIKNAIGDKNV